MSSLTKKNIVALIVLILVLGAFNVAHAEEDLADTPSHWIHDLFTEGVRVTVLEDFSGNAFDDKRAIGIRFCVIAEGSQLSNISEDGDGDGFNAANVDIFEEFPVVHMFKPDMTVTLYGSGYGDAVQAGTGTVVTFCILGEPCDTPVLPEPDPDYVPGVPVTDEPALPEPEPNPDYVPGVPVTDEPRPITGQFYEVYMPAIYR